MIFKTSIIKNIAYFKILLYNDNKPCVEKGRIICDRERKRGRVVLKKLIWCVSLGICLSLAGCNDGKEVTDAQSLAETGIEEENKLQTVAQGEDKETDKVGEEELPDLPVWSPEYIISYIKFMNFDVHDFTREMRESEKNFGELDFNKMCYVSDFSFGIGSPKYEQVYSESDLVYVGRMKDEKPDGFGVLIKMVNVDDIGVEKVNRMVYTGMFKKGKYDGFGLLYCADHGDAEQEYYYFIKQAEEPQETTTQYLNELTYMGYFEKGYCSEKGISIGYPGLYQYLQLSEEKIEEAIKEAPNEISVLSGEFKKGQTNGKIKLYYGGFLLYEGIVKNGKIHEKGTEYYTKSTQKKYEGELSNGVYWGEGTLYDQEGNIVCSGQWKNNMCGVINADDYISSAEKEKLIKELIEAGVDLESEDGQMLIKQRGLENEYSRIKEDVGLSEDNVEVLEENDERNIVLDATEQDYIFPESNVRYLTDEDLNGLDKATLRLGRNEIYARHGRAFQTEDLNQYFNSKSWYYGYLSAEEFDDSVLNVYEKANLDIIKSAEAE